MYKRQGLDITKERGNANVLLTRILASAEDRTGTKLVTITGGLQNNAICREAEAAVTIAKDKKAELQDLVQEWQKILKKEFKISDPDVKVVLDEAEKAETRFTAEGSAKIIDFMMSLRQRCDRDEHGSSGCCGDKRKRRNDRHRQ